MQTVWVVGNAKEIMQIPLEYSTGYLDYGGSAYGTETNPPTIWENPTHPGQCKS